MTTTLVRSMLSMAAVSSLASALASPRSCARERADDGSGATTGPLRVREAWVRSTNVTRAAAMYLSLENRDSVDVHVIGATSPLATHATLHETTDRQGMSHMAAVPDLRVARGATVTLQPGGLHLMLNDLSRTLTKGDTVPLDLRLSDGQTTHVVAIVRAP